MAATLLPSDSRAAHANATSVMAGLHVDAKRALEALRRDA
jgi:hypothetical protein